eukprot:6259404-Pyramimonas_sp.AAC.1
MILSAPSTEVGRYGVEVEGEADKRGIAGRDHDRSGTRGPRDSEFRPPGAFAGPQVQQKSIQDERPALGRGSERFATAL